MFYHFYYESFFALEYVKADDGIPNRPAGIASKKKGGDTKHRDFGKKPNK